MKPLLVATLSLLGLSGCYLAHGLPAEEPVERADAGRATLRDGGPTMPRPDAGAPPRPRDAGPPLPPEPDPDLGPDARPSDYPEADEWLEPPELGEDDPCCTLDEPIRIASRDDGIVIRYERPSIAWGPGRWGVLAMRYFSERDWEEHDPRAVLVELDADGRRLDLVELEPLAVDGVIRWAEGRWAIGLRSPDGADASRRIIARLYDRDLRPAGDWLTLSPAENGPYDLARSSHTDRWVGLIGATDELRVRSFGEHGMDPPVTHAPASAGGVRAVGLRSRVAVLLAQHSESPTPNVVRVFGGDPEHPELGRVDLASRYPREGAAATALRDLAFMVGIEAGHAYVEVIDPFAMTLVSGRRDLGVAVTAEEHYLGPVDAAGSSKLGVVGACWGVSDGPREGGRPSGIDFRLIGPDGIPRGRAVRIVDSTFRGTMPNCAVGSNEDGFLVAWRDTDALWVRRVRVMR